VQPYSESRVRGLVSGRTWVTAGYGGPVSRDGTHLGTFGDGLRRHLREPPFSLTLRSSKVRTASPREAIMA
jgi:hypothetical protein